MIIFLKLRPTVFLACLHLLAGCGSEKDVPGDTEPTSAPTSDATTETTLAPTGTDPTTAMEATATETTAAPTDTSTTDEAPAECACIDGEQYGGNSYVCPNDGCELIAATCSPPDSDDEIGCQGTFVIDEAALDCALERLRLGTEGLVIWQFDPAGDTFMGSGAFVQVLPSRQGLTRDWKWMDNDWKDGRAGVVTLKSLEYFEGCASEPDPLARFQCMIAWSDEEPAAQCDEGGTLPNDNARPPARPDLPDVRLPDAP